MSVLKRTHTCGELRKSDVGKTVVLTGWIHSRRDHGGLTFVDVRDRYGLTQVVFSPQLDKALHEQAQGLRSEYVVAVKGVVAERPAGTVNPKIATGEVEINAQELQLLNKAAQAPFSVTDEGVSLDLRLKYRFIDLRREEMQRRLIFRHRICQLARTYF
ncbi:MAG: aspartate--tRNA ligase, partial [Planctomycetes bacterium]|nr:aspartate--tRNA ligase [Planctomycetota bacterium]